MRSRRAAFRLLALLAGIALVFAQATTHLANQAPSVAITAPADTSAFVSGTTIAITASASDADGGIARVAFYADGALLGRDSAAPYALDWANSMRSGPDCS